MKRIIKFTIEKIAIKSIVILNLITLSDVPKK